MPQELTNRLLTETELEIMCILWQLTEGSASDVLAKIYLERPLAYTSVSTMLRILEKKKFVSCRKEGRGHVYFPLITKLEYESRSLNSLINQVFDGDKFKLVKHLFDEKDLDESTVKAIKDLIKKHT